MKKLSFLSILIVFAFTAAQAQIKTKAQKTRLQAPSKIIDPVPAEPKTPPPPAPINKTPVTGNQNTSAYSLTSARVTIRTGADNKEFPSKVIVWLTSRVGPALEQPEENLRNEMKSNSNTEFGLQNSADQKWNNPTYRTLEAFQKEGLVLRIRYYPNFPTDAWKIEDVSITLEFKDQNGNLHPELGNKTIVFNNANGFLNVFEKDMVCKTDANFNPLTSSIQQ